VGEVFQDKESIKCVMWFMVAGCSESGESTFGFSNKEVTTLLNTRCFDETVEKKVCLE
jgi:hypothetical protein